MMCSDPKVLFYLAFFQNFFKLTEKVVNLTSKGNQVSQN